jgi:hypothetical protein
MKAFGWSLFLLGLAVDAYVPSLSSRRSPSVPSQLHQSAEANEVSRRQVLERAAGAAVATSSGLWLPPPAVAADSAPVTVPTVRLGSLQVSRTIQGYWQLAGGHGRYKEADAIDNMKAHLAAGITTLDTADIYGPSELIVGRFAKSAPAAVPCTKFCCFRFLDEIDREEVKTRIQSACERLQVTKLPLVQFFWSNYDVKRCVCMSLPATAS